MERRQCTILKIPMGDCEQMACLPLDDAIPRPLVPAYDRSSVRWQPKRQIAWIPQEQQTSHARWAIKCTNEEPKNILAGQVLLRYADNLWQLVEMAISAGGAEALDVEPGALCLRHFIRVHDRQAHSIAKSLAPFG